MVNALSSVPGVYFQALKVPRIRCAVKMFGLCLWQRSFQAHPLVTGQRVQEGNAVLIRYKQEFPHALSALQDVSSYSLWAVAPERAGLMWPLIPAAVDRNSNGDGASPGFCKFFQNISGLLKTWCKSKLFKYYLDWTLPPTSLQQLTRASWANRAAIKPLSCGGGKEMAERAPLRPLPSWTLCHRCGAPSGRQGRGLHQVSPASTQLGFLISVRIKDILRDGGGGLVTMDFTSWNIETRRKHMYLVSVWKQ